MTLKASYYTSGLSILMYGVILLSDATSYDKLKYNIGIPQFGTDHSLLILIVRSLRYESVKILTKKNKTNQNSLTTDVYWNIAIMSAGILIARSYMASQLMRTNDWYNPS